MKLDMLKDNSCFVIHTNSGILWLGKVIEILSRQDAILIYWADTCNIGLVSTTIDFSVVDSVELIDESLFNVLNNVV